MDAGPIHKQFKSSSPPATSSMESSMAAIEIPTTQNTNTSPSGIISMDTTGTGRTTPPSTNNHSDVNLNLNQTSSSSSPSTSSSLCSKNISPERTSSGTSARCSTTRSDAAAQPISPRHTYPSSFAIEPASRMMTTRSSR